MMGLTGMAACYITAAVPWSTVRAWCIVLRVLLVGPGSLSKVEAESMIHRVSHGRYRKEFGVAELFCCCGVGCLRRLQLGLGVAGLVVEDPRLKGPDEEEDEVPVSREKDAVSASRLARVRMLGAVGSDVAPPAAPQEVSGPPALPAEEEADDPGAGDRAAVVVVVEEPSAPVDPPPWEAAPGEQRLELQDKIKVALDN